MNAILRYVFMLLTSKISTLQQDEGRSDDPHKCNARGDAQKLGRLTAAAQLESKSNPALA